MSHTPTTITPQGLIKGVCATLHATYGSPRLNNKRNPLDELIFILISQKTGSWSYEPAYLRLRRAFPSWEQARRASAVAIASIIKPAGLSNNKAHRIKATLDHLRRDFGRTTLAPVRQMNNEDAQAYLVGLPGVGEKTAKCVLMYALGREVLPVDTHVRRVAFRLGLLPDRVSDRAAHEYLAQLVPPALRYGFHVNAVVHGRAVCTKLRPRCSDCTIRRWCSYTPSEGVIADRNEQSS